MIDMDTSDIWIQHIIQGKKYGYSTPAECVRGDIFFKFDDGWYICVAILGDKGITNVWVKAPRSKEPVKE
jgi:hypothetical protein